MDFDSISNHILERVKTHDKSWIQSWQEIHIDNKPIEKLEHFVQSLKNEYVIIHEQFKCFYNPASDFINVPPITQFRKSERYYHILFHELIHATGHSRRLNRKLGFFGVEYNHEEIIAEIGCYYLCAHFEIAQEIEDVSLSYLKHYVQESFAGNETFKSLATEAKRAVEYLLKEQVTA